MADSTRCKTADKINHSQKIESLGGTQNERITALFLTFVLTRCLGLNSLAAVPFDISGFYGKKDIRITDGSNSVIIEYASTDILDVKPFPGLINIKRAGGYVKLFSTGIVAPYILADSYGEWAAFCIMVCHADTLFWEPIDTITFEMAGKKIYVYEILSK